MPRIDVTQPTLADIWMFQYQNGLSDVELAEALLGAKQGVTDIVRSWRDASFPPSPGTMRAFYYLRALTRIAAEGPLDGEEIFAIAHDALPEALK